jgi:hypothetical protein
MENQDQKETSEIKLDRKSKILFIILALLIIASVAVTYWRYMVKRDYIIQAQIDCDPETENCFVWRCDPGSLEEGEKCTGVPDNDIWYYKILNRNAKNIPDCDPTDENCTAYQCETNETDCSIANCDPASVGKNEECSLPEQYLLENPPEEESADCAEGDEECAAAENAEEECSPDDEECASQEDTETGEITPAGQDVPEDAAAPAQ